MKIKIEGIEWIRHKGSSRWHFSIFKIKKILFSLPDWIIMLIDRIVNIEHVFLFHFSFFKLKKILFSLFQMKFWIECIEWSVELERVSEDIHFSGCRFLLPRMFISFAVMEMWRNSFLYDQVPILVLFHSEENVAVLSVGSVPFRSKVCLAFLFFNRR